MFDPVSCNPNRECRYRDNEGCRTDTHHIYYPKKTVRALGVRSLTMATVEHCRAWHDEIHALQQTNLPTEEIINQHREGTVT